MKKVSLSGSLRENVGKKDAVKLRNEGRIPCVVYGGETQTHFHVLESAINKLVWSGDIYQVEIDVDGKKKNAIIQEIQQHPVSDRLLHVDFLELGDKPVKISLPVRFSGMSEGVRNGGRLMTTFRKLTVLGNPNKLPEAIEIDITNLKIGDGVRVRDVETEDLNILETPGSMIVAVKMSRNATLDEEEEAAEGATEGASEEATE